MKKMKRVLSLLLCFVMVLGLLPLTALAAESDTLLDAAIFFSDVHGSASDLTNVLKGVATSDVTYSGVGLDGDTCLTISTVSSTIASALNYTPENIVYSYASSHDTENSSDIGFDWDWSGKACETDQYIIYTIRETDMKSSSDGKTAAAAFTTWYGSLSDAQKGKVIFILSHRPLHKRRSDNAGASYWYTAISAAAETSDIVFFWGHNHTSETSEDTNAYYVAKNGSETMTIQGGSTVTPNFTYMNAGYINANNQSPARKGIATTVQIYAGNMVFQDYNSSGTYTGTYAHNVTVTRDHATASSTEKTLSSITLSGVDNHLYKLGNSLESFTVTAVYSDSTTETVTDYVVFGFDSSKAGKQTVTVTYSDKTATFDVVVAASIVATKLELVEEDLLAVTYTCYLSDTSTTAEAGDVEIAENDDGSLTVVEYIATDDSRVTASGNVYTAVTSYGTVSTTADTSNGSGEATTVEKDVYVLVDSLTVGKDYLIANGNSGTVTLLGQSSGSATTTNATVVTEGDYTYIETADSAYVWNATEHTNSSASGPRLINNGYAMFYSSGLSISNSYSSNAGNTRYWTYANGVLSCPSTNSNSNTYHLTYSGSSFSMTNSSSTGIYIYEKQTITVSGDSSSSGGSSSDGGSTDSGNTGVEGEDFKNVTIDTTTSSTKTVYVLTSSITSGTRYLIVNTNSAGSGYALKNNSGSVAATNVTVKTDSSIGTYIELDDATNELWTVGTSSNSYTFMNKNYYVYHNSGNLSLSNNTSKITWTFSTNQLYYTGGRTTRYLTYSSGWTLSTTESNVYFYVPTEITVETGSKITYSVSAADITHYIEDAENPGAETINASILAGDTAITTLGGSYSYKVVDGSDTNGIITSIADDGTITFTGSTGEAKVKVSYTFTVGNNTYTIWQIITVTAKNPTYEAHIYQVDFEEATDVTSESFSSGTYYTYNSSTGWYTKADSYVDGTTYYTYHSGSYGEDVCDKTFYLKGVTSGQTYALLSDLRYVTGTSEDPVTSYESVTWSVNNESIATIEKTETGYGLLKFTGEDGTVSVTVSYTRDGVTYTATTTISVTSTEYFVPSDGTDDFPEYPNQGAVRFDKTATAVGSFSQTGIAQVELSMTGVPYTTGSAIDVLLMLDMSTSMDTEVATSTDRVDVTIAAAKAFAKTIVQNEDGTYNDNQIAIKYFNGSTVYTTTDYISVSSDEELVALNTLIEKLSTPDASGTYYSTAMANAYNTIITNDAKSDHTQALVFMSDGGPTYYTYLNDSGTGTTTGGSDGSFVKEWFNYSSTPYSVTSSFKTEYYSYLLKQAGYPVYTVGLGLSTTNSSSGPSFYRSLTSAQQLFITSYILEQMATNANYFYSIEDSDAVASMGNIFSGIASSIKEAAKDVVVEDKIADEYTMTFKLPNTGVTKDDVGMDEFYIQVVEYVLDENHERTGTYNTLENFTFYADGTLKSHTVDGAACGDTCSHVTFTDGVVTAIYGTYFQYYITESGAEMLKWTADKLTSNELALQYFVYLDNSAGSIAAADQVDAGTYPTNEYATLTYTNYKGNRVQQEFPIPQLTWKGAQVSYVFYLVNKDGQPVNRAGTVVPFAEAVYVTDVYTYAVTWNELSESGNASLSASYLAESLVPSVYKLYDSRAQYDILVYETEGVDGDDGKSYSNFTISGGEDDGQTSSTTKVFNTKAGTKYSAYATYSSRDASMNGFDFANTTVAFAVVWTPELVEDVVVVDFGLDVVIDVIKNDGVEATVTGVMKNAPSEVVMNSGTYSNQQGKASIENADGFWKASSESNNNNAVRFSITDTQFSEPAVFYYEASVKYLAEENTYNTAYMYSSVTVIPATTIYYEDSFLTLASYTKGENGNYTEDSTSQWEKDGSTNSNATQDVDRPGADKIGSGYDADNVYGYDSAYTTCSQYSLGSAMKITVNENTYGTASFSFYGTGFDVIGLTSNTSGTLAIKVTDKDGNKREAVVVDTYYGYTYSEEDGWQVADSTDPNALYQVPVMKISGLDYDYYNVTITATYASAFDNTNEGSYALYLDAVRIYNPCGTGNSVVSTDDDDNNTTVSDVYVTDNEVIPEYIELRNQVIDEPGYSVNEDGNVTSANGQSYTIGAIFIDGIGANTSITNYVNYGPNNELYLAKEQSIAFKISAENVADIQIALKLASGNSVTCTINDTTFTIQTATDLYYSIQDLIGNDKLVTITNTSEAVLSITNIKITHTASTATATSLYMDEEGATAVVQSLMAIGQVVETPEEIPEETEAPTEETEEPSEDATEEPTEDPTETPSEGDSNDSWEDTVTSTITTIIKAVSSLLKKWFR